MTKPEPVLLARIGKPNSASLETYLQDGGYDALKKAFGMAPADVINAVKDSGLRGRGGAGFPTGVKWTFLPKDHPGPIYLAINADESEPGTFNNRILMEKDPHQVLEGIAISCHAIKSNKAFVYLRYEYGEAWRAMNQAVKDCYAQGIFGKNIFGSGIDLDVQLHRGAAAYICGEETGLIESLEGKRAWPRIKPPFPAIEGLFRKPTIVNNIETMACVTQILKRGGEWFKSMGVPPDPNNPRDAGSYGPKLYCLSGHVNKPGCYELPLGITAREIIYDVGGGVPGGHGVKAVIPGGISMGFMTAAELDTKLDFNGPGKVGCLGLGTAAVIVINDQTSIVDAVYNCARFFAHESCGQCTPCREGSAWIAKILHRIRSGGGTLADLDLLTEVGSAIGMMPGTTICGLADGAGWHVKTAVRKFRAEFEAYIQSGQKSPYVERELAAAH